MCFKHTVHTVSEIAFVLLLARVSAFCRFGPPFSPIEIHDHRALLIEDLERLKKEIVR